MDKNIAALLRHDAKTIRVTFTPSRYDNEYIARNGGEKEQTKLYNYVTHLDVKVGDQVLVEAAGQMKVVTVVNVDDTVQVQPNAEYELRWVIMKIDLTEHEANMERNRKIEEAVADAYRANLRRSFAAQILSGVEGDARLQLENLLK